jgi:hypothetical protein
MVAATILCGGYAVRRAWWEQGHVTFHVYWLTLVVTLPASFWLLGREEARPLWALVLLVDLWGLVWPLVAVRPEAEIYRPSTVMEPFFQGDPDRGRVLDRDSDERGTCSPFGRGVPAALIFRVEAVRGYNPLDVRRFKEYLQFIGGREGELRPFEGDLTFPLIGNVDVVNKSLVDLLGVRYALQPADLPAPAPGWRRIQVDEDPSAYDFISGGTRPLGSYALYENPDAFARAFVVPNAKPSPADDVLAALERTDFHQDVLLEDGWNDPPETSKSIKARSATIKEYQPNRVVVEVEAGDPGYLVLADVWYPGWQCAVDGEPATLHRANYLFRATPLGEGSHQIVFTFAPQSYQRGKWVSLLAVLMIASIGCIGLSRRVWPANSNRMP